MQYSSRVKAWTRSAIALLSGFALLGCAPANLSGAAVSPAPSPAAPSPSASSPSAQVPSSPPPAVATPPAASPQRLIVRRGPARSSEELWALLRQEPGLVVLFRHARAPGTGDPATFRLEDCATQRNLNAEGQQQSRQLGDAFRQRQIPVARVLSSQWCRSLDTARLMDLAPVEPFPALNSFFGDRTREPQQTRALQQFIPEQRNTPGVSILVTHQINITALTDIVPREGEAVIVHALPQGEIEIVGRL
jgi:phosphohistidine phosphatase SixA